MPADYKKANRAIMQAHTMDAVAAGLTRYFGANGDLYAAEANAQFTCPSNGILTEMYARAHVAPGGVTTFIYTLMLNGAPTAMTCTTTGAAFDSSDILNPIAVVKGDNLSIEIVTLAAAAAASHAITFELNI